MEDQREAGDDAEGAPAPRLLVVEDDPAVRAALRRQLSLYFTITEADSVAAAVARGREGGLAAVLLDLGLPDGSGIDVLTKLRAQWVELPTVVLSGALSPSAYKAAFEMGVTEVLEKGCSTDDIVSALRYAIEAGASVRGSIHGLTLVDMLQMFHFARRSLSVEVYGAGGGRIDLRQGEIVHVEAGELRGADALQYLLGHQQAHVRTSLLEEEGPNTVDAPFEALLLDCLRLVDEGSMDAQIPSLFPAAPSFPPPVPAAEADVDPALLEAIEGTVGRLCSGAQVLLARRDGELCWLYSEDPSAHPHPLWLAAVDVVRERFPKWRWVVRVSAGLAVGMIHLGGGDVVTVYSRLSSPASQGVFHIAILRASERVTVTPRDSVTVDVDVDVDHLGPPSGELGALCQRVVEDARGALLHGCRVWDDRGHCFVGVHEVHPVPSEAWGLTCELLHGSLREAFGSLVGDEDRHEEATILLGYEGGLVFGRALDGESSRSVLLATDTGVNIGMVNIRIRTEVEPAVASYEPPHARRDSSMPTMPAQES